MRILQDFLKEDLSFDAELVLYGLITMILCFVLITLFFTSDYGFPNPLETTYTYTLPSYSYIPNAHDIGF